MHVRIELLGAIIEVAFIYRRNEQDVIAQNVANIN